MEEKEPNRIIMGELELTLRPADERDLSFCYELMRQSMRDLFDRNTQEKWSRAKFRTGFKPDRVKVIEHKGMSVGFYDCEITGNELYFHNIQLSEDYRTGIGNKIMEFIEQTAKNYGAKFIIGKVFSENARIIGWLQRFNYKVEGKIEKENSYWIRKDLGARQ